MASCHIFRTLLVCLAATLSSSHDETRRQAGLSVVPKTADDASIPYYQLFKRLPDSKQEVDFGNEDAGFPSTPSHAQSFGFKVKRKAEGNRDVTAPGLKTARGNFMDRKSNAARAGRDKTSGVAGEFDLQKGKGQGNLQDYETTYEYSFSTPKSHRSRKSQTRPNSTRAEHRGKKKSNFLCGPKSTCLCIFVHGNIRVNCSSRNFTTFPELETYNALGIDISYNNLTRFAFSTLIPFYRLMRIDLTHNSISQLSVFGTNQVATSLENLNLNENQIDDVSDVPFYVFHLLKTLSLSRNVLTSISSRPFSGLESLDFLDLSHNKITKIDEMAFSSLRRLRTLRLNHNPQLGYGNLSANLFQSLTSLQVLWMQGNSIKIIDQSYPNVALGKLSNLRELVIDGLGGGAHLGIELNHLKYFSTLLFGYGGNCFIEDISPTFFNNMRGLKTLIFSNCSFTIQPDAFKRLPYLTNYTIQFPSKGYEFCKAFADLEGLKYTSVHTLALVGFVQGSIKCRSLFLDKARHINRLKSLTGLYLDYNYISTIDGEFLENLPKNLVKLSLRGNAFTLADESWNKLYNFTNLQEIDVRDQNLHFSWDEMEYWSNNLGTYDGDVEYLQGWALEGVGGDLTSCKHSHKLNPSSQFEDNMFDRRKKPNCTDDGIVLEKGKCDPEIEICLPPNLLYLRASGLTQFGKGILYSNLSSNRLCYLDFSRCYITEWGNGHLPASVEVADLGHNFCDTLQPTFFPENNSLIDLRIQNNYLGPAFSMDKNGTIFSRLRKLTHLNIAMNNIFYLPPSFFKNLTNLRFLNMSENKIETIDLDFDGMTMLNFIDMTRNAISWISRKSRRQLDVIAKETHLQIDIGDNPLPCTCVGIEFLKWMNDSLVGIVNRKLLKCNNGQKDEVPLTDITRIIEDLEKKCLRDPQLIIVASCSGFLVAIVFAGGMLYKHRWKLIYAFNTWLVKRWGFRPQAKDNSHKMFDAYVVYSEDDRDFVLDVMTVEMESKRGHKLCLDDRDFIPGTFNFNNITRAVQDSSRTLLLLSPEFLRSKDLRYATRMALMEEYSGQHRRPVIFLIRYKHVSDKDMPKDFLLLMKKDRYLDFPHYGDDSTNQRFWDRLSAVIGQTRNISP